MLDLDKHSLPFLRYERMIEYFLKNLKPIVTDDGKIRLSKVTDKDCDGPQCDHKYSISKGWSHKVSPLLLADPRNVELLPKSENREKASNCSITLDELYTLTGYSKEQSEAEFETILKILEEDHENKEVHVTTHVLRRVGLMTECKRLNDIIKNHTR